MAASEESNKEQAQEDEFAAVREGLGREVRRLRKKARLNGRQLAEQAGITPGFVSQLEQGQATPSVATLLKISFVLGVSIGELFEATQSVDPVVRAAERPTYPFPDAGFTDERVSTDPTGQLQVLTSTISAGGGSGVDLYTHGARVEFVLVVEGNLELHLGDDTHLLNEGDAATFSGDTPHGYRNPGPGDTQVVWVMTPATY